MSFRILGFGGKYCDSLVTVRVIISYGSICWFHVEAPHQPMTCDVAILDRDQGHLNSIATFLKGQQGRPLLNFYI
jgi:hypothetical protein